MDKNEETMIQGGLGREVGAGLGVEWELLPT